MKAKSEQIWVLCFFLLVLSADAAVADSKADDHRAWQHGIDLIRVGDKWLVVWGSAGNPPHPNIGGDWPHDVYYAWLDTLSIPYATTIEPQVLVSRPEAQEPPSAAINSRGTILMTSEDGNGGINQHAGLWNSSLSVLRPYPFTIKRGGHSGHVAAMGNRFLVVYGEGWVEGGGWHSLGTGENVYARVVENNGKLEREVKLTPNREARPRDSWPLVAGSDRSWLAVWQRYPELTLQSALIDASGNVVKRSQIIGEMSPRYTYDVEFAESLSMYVISGVSDTRGFISLVSLNGDVIRTQRNLPSMISESRILLHWDGSRLIGVYPVNPRGIAVVRLSCAAIDVVKLVDNPYAWDYMGTSGTFVSAETVLFVTLSTIGLRLIPINLND